MRESRQVALRLALERLEPRQSLLQEKCAASLIADQGLAPATASALAEQWSDLLRTLKNLEAEAWPALAWQFGAWCAAQRIPFEVVAAQMHAYKRAATPLLVREYPGVEGYLEAMLVLDEALTLLIGKIPGGYYGAGPA